MVLSDVKHLRTLPQLEAELNGDLSNRLQEISRFRDVVHEKKGGLAETPLLRASVTLFYAHWEGYAKSSAERYVRYVLSQQYVSDDLCSAIVAYYLDPGAQGARIIYGRSSVRDLVREIRRKAPVKVAPKTTIKIDTASNLSYEVACKMADAIGVSGMEALMKRDFVNGSLLAKRNAIAHGQSAPISFSDVDNYRTETIRMMRGLKDRLLDAASADEFLRKNEVLV